MSTHDADLKLKSLESFLNEITEDTSFSEFMQRILLVIHELIPSEAASILELHENGQFLFFRAALGPHVEDLFHFKIPTGKGIVGQVVESKSPLWIDNVKEHEQHMKVVGTSVQFESRNLVAFPILIRNKIYGVIELLNRADEDHFSTHDFEILDYFCKHAAKAIEIRMMMNWVRQKNQEDLI